MELKNLQLVKELETVSGEGKDGKPWKKTTILCDMQDGEYTKPLVLSAWGDVANKAQEMVPGTVFDTAIRVECREYNGKWYTNLVSWMIKNRQAPSAAPPPAPAKAGGKDDDLPF